MIEEGLSTGLYISFDRAPSDTTTLIGDASRIPLRDGSVGVVVCTEALQHFPNPRCVLEEMRRVLVPGGLMILSFPFIYAECDVLDFYRWSMLGMETELARCGFEVVDARRRGGFCFVAVCGLQWVVQHAIPGARLSWRSGLTPLAILRAVVVVLLTLPTATLGWLALGIDWLIPAKGAYMGGLILARRPRVDAAP